MALLQRLSLRLSGRQLAAGQQAAAFHLSATLDARRKSSAGDGSSSDSDDEQARPRANPKPEAPHQAAAEEDQEFPPLFDPSVLRGPDGRMPGKALSDLLLDPANERWDVNTIISPALAEALKAAPEGEDAMTAVEELHEAAEAIESGRELEGDAPASDDDLRRLAEAIDLYFLAAPGSDSLEDDDDDEGEEGDEADVFSAAIDRATLAALGDTIQEVLDGGARSTVINTAPPGRLPWEVLEVESSFGADEETAQPMVNWAVDLTEGKAQDPWRAAHLSSETKEHMWRLHSKEGYSAEQLAETFGIRPQRAMAILALKEREHAARQAGQPLHEDLQELMDEAHGADEVMGARERHHVVLPSYPNFHELTEADADRLAALLEQRLGKTFDDVTPEDMTPEVTQELLAAAGMDKGALEEELAAKEEEHLVAEFRRRLEFNLGKTGAGLSRASRRTHPLKRPESGWSLLVEPLGKAAKAAQAQPYVAQPDGSKRELTEDEKLYLERQQPLPRARIP